MTIRKVGAWETGEASDLDEYLSSYGASFGMSIGRVVHAQCQSCSGSTFAVRVDDEQGYADRRCSPCGDTRIMLDGADVVSDALPEAAECPCGHSEFATACGFALTSSGEVRWVYVALRCAADGVLGVYTDWKVDYEPSTHLLTQV